MIITRIELKNDIWTLRYKAENIEKTDLFLWGEKDNCPIIIELNDYVDRNEGEGIVKIPLKLFESIIIDQNISLKLCNSFNLKAAIHIEKTFEDYCSKLWMEGDYNIRLIVEAQTIYFHIEKIPRIFKVSMLKVKDHILILNLENIYSNGIDCASLYLKRRLTEHIWQYNDREIHLGHFHTDGKISVKIPFDLLEDENQTQFFDLILRRKKGKISSDYFLSIEKNDMRNIIDVQEEDGGNKIIELFCSAGKNLSMKFFAKREEKNLNELVIKGHLINISLKDDLQECSSKLVVRKRTYSNEKRYCVKWEKDFKIEKSVNVFEERTENFLRGLIKSRDEHWDVFVEQNQVLYPIKCDSINTKYFDVADGFKICFFCNKEKHLSVYTHEGDHSEYTKTRIAVLGTCFSRSVFKSDPYFNPDYKRFYECVYTQFHSSIISLTSEKFLNYEHKDEWNKEASLYLPTEFNKDFFENLRKSKAEYLLLDNYIDATRPVIDVGDGAYITYNKYLIRSNLIRDLSRCRIIKPGTNEFYDLYKEHAKQFLHETKKIMPENHIILLEGRFSYFKIDEKTNIKEEWEGRTYIHRNNIRWNEVDHIFRLLAPDIRVIDMRNTQYVSDVRTPIPGGASPSHYQKYYYREILDKINKIILEDKVSKGGTRV